MSIRINAEQAEQWSRIAGKLREASRLAEECETILLLEMGITDGKALEAVKSVCDASRGMAYIFTPQTEWTGGDSSEAKNHVQTLPHIAK